MTTEPRKIIPVQTIQAPALRPAVGMDPESARLAEKFLTEMKASRWILTWSGIKAASGIGQLYKNLRG